MLYSMASMMINYYSSKDHSTDRCIRQGFFLKLRYPRRIEFRAILPSRPMARNGVPMMEEQTPS